MSSGKSGQRTYLSGAIIKFIHIYTSICILFLAKNQMTFLTLKLGNYEGAWSHPPALASL